MVGSAVPREKGKKQGGGFQEEDAAFIAEVGCKIWEVSRGIIGRENMNAGSRLSNVRVLNISNTLVKMLKVSLICYFTEHLKFEELEF